MKGSKINQAGFTLVELLVVISIISLLASIVTVSVNGARLKARNVKRVSDLRGIQTALELYYNEYSSYPLSGGTWRGQCGSFGAWPQDQVIPGLVPNFMNKFPADPSMNLSVTNACYIYKSDGVDYALVDHLIDKIEVNAFDYKAYPDFIDPYRDGGTNPCIVDGIAIWAWKVSSPGYVCQ